MDPPPVSSQHGRGKSRPTQEAGGADLHHRAATDDHPRLLLPLCGGASVHDPGRAATLLHPNSENTWPGRYGDTFRLGIPCAKECECDRTCSGKSGPRRVNRGDDIWYGRSSVHRSRHPKGSFHPVVFPRCLYFLIVVGLCSHVHDNLVWNGLLSVFRCLKL